jgi:hypothetical protein
MARGTMDVVRFSKDRKHRDIILSYGRLKHLPSSPLYRGLGVVCILLLMGCNTEPHRAVKFSNSIIKGDLYCNIENTALGLL